MRKIILFVFVGILGFSLLGCSNQKVAVQDKEKVDLGPTKRKFIIKDSVNDPVPKEAQKIENMPNSAEPQQIPNAQVNDPIVITKMPVTKE